MGIMDKIASDEDYSILNKKINAYFKSNVTNEEVTKRIQNLSQLTKETDAIDDIYYFFKLPALLIAKSFKDNKKKLPNFVNADIFSKPESKISDILYYFDSNTKDYEELESLFPYKINYMDHDSMKGGAGMII